MPKAKKYARIDEDDTLVLEMKEVFRSETMCIACRQGMQDDLMICRSKGCYHTWCISCIPVPKSDKECFICPHCWNIDDKLEGSYPWRPSASSVTALESLTEFNLHPVVILDFRLKGLPSTAHGELGKRLATQLYHLNDWIDMHFVHEFNIGQEKSTGLAETIAKVKGCVEQVEEGWKARIVVIVTTPSNEITGHLQASVDGSEIAPSNLFDILLPLSLRMLLRARQSILILLSGGSIFACKKPFADVLNLVPDSIDSGNPQSEHRAPAFQSIIGFTRPRLSVLPLRQFFQDFIVSWFVLNRSTLKAVLPGRSAMGLYTDLVHFEAPHTDLKGVSHPRRVTRYIHSNPALRPFGGSLGDQCPQCYFLTHLDVKKASKTWIILFCSSCKKKIGFHRPRGYVWVFDWHQLHKRAESKKKKRAAKKEKEGRERPKMEGAKKQEVKEKNPEVWICDTNRMWLKGPFPAPTCEKLGALETYNASSNGRVSKPTSVWEVGENFELQSRSPSPEVYPSYLV
ncbi:hypothetical protein BKA70DRAFT_1414549 [Coprinopsis sp. MPI-PUGE-AT-0042]|nr:hypothetical protein BKA70DRAFT_1414549 [Coprinopsis sp. MPI-PUGE-AT-0042]